VPEYRLIAIKDRLLPSDDLLVDEEAKQVLIVGNQLQLSKQVYPVQQIPLLVSVGSKQHIQYHALEALDQRGVTTIFIPSATYINGLALILRDFWSLEDLLIVLAHVEVGRVVEADLDHVLVVLESHILDLRGLKRVDYN